MLPAREEDLQFANYQENLKLVRERVLGYVLRRMVPHAAGFAQAEDIAQSCVVALWEQYGDRRELAEMVRIAVGVARNKIAQFHRDRERMPGISDAAADRWESRHPQNPHSGERVFEHLAARQDLERLLRGMLELPARCRELMRLKLIEQKPYPEIREVTDFDDDVEGAGVPDVVQYPVITGDYAAEQATWARRPIEVGRPLAKPTPLFTKLDPKLGETGPSWAPIA